MADVSKAAALPALSAFTIVATRDRFQRLYSSAGSVEKSPTITARKPRLRPMTAKLLLKTLPMRNFSGRSCARDVTMPPALTRLDPNWVKAMQNLSAYENISASSSTLVPSLTWRSST